MGKFVALFCQFTTLLFFILMHIRVEAEPLEGGAYYFPPCDCRLFRATCTQYGYIKFDQGEPPKDYNPQLEQDRPRIFARPRYERYSITDEILCEQIKNWWGGRGAMYIEVPNPGRPPCTEKLYGTITDEYFIVDPKYCWFYGKDYH